MFESFTGRLSFYLIDCQAHLVFKFTEYILGKQFCTCVYQRPSQLCIMYTVDMQIENNYTHI